MPKHGLSKPDHTSAKDVFSADLDYKKLLNEIKSKLKVAQLRAAVSVNIELIRFYWDIGRLILERQENTK